MSDPIAGVGPRGVPGNMRMAYWGARRPAAEQRRIERAAQRGLLDFLGELWDRANPNGVFNWGSIEQPTLPGAGVDETDLHGIRQGDQTPNMIRDPDKLPMPRSGPTRPTTPMPARRRRPEGTVQA